MTKEQREKINAYFKSIGRADLAEFHDQISGSSDSVTVPGWELPERRLEKRGDEPAVTIAAVASNSMSRPEINERLELAKQYGPSAVQNIAEEVRRRNFPPQLREQSHGFGF